MISDGPSITLLADFVNGFAFKSEHFEDEGLPVIRIKQLLDSNAEGDRTTLTVPEVMINNGDVIFSWSASLAVRIWDRGPALLNQHLFRVDPKPGVHSGWLAYTLMVAAKRLEALMHGSAMTHITRDMLKLVTVTLPPEREQRAIADYLDAETARIDALIEKKRYLVNKLKERLQATIDTELGGEDTSETLLKRYTTKIGSGKTPSGGYENYVSSGVMFLRSQNVGDGELLLEDVAHIRDEVDSEMHSTRVEVGDVLLNITGGSIGRSATFPQTLNQANVNQHVCIVRLRKEIAPRLIEFNLRSSRAQEFIRVVQVGGNRDGLNFEQVGAIPVVLPHASEHVATVRALEHAEENYQRARDLLVRQIELLIEHRQALITAAVTGQLEVPGTQVS